MAAVALVVTGCGDGGESEKDTPTSAGLPDKTSCAAKTAAPTPGAKFSSGKPEAGITVSEPSQGLIAHVVPLKAEVAKSVTVEEPEKLEASAKKGTLLFVTFKFTNDGKAPIQPAEVASLFRVQLDGNVYEQPELCRAAQVFTRKKDLAQQRGDVAPGKRAEAVAAYVVPHGGPFDWLAGTTKKKFSLSTD